MSDDDDKRIAFDREKAVFEQNCAQLRTLIQEFHKKPIMSATLTGGLWATISIFKVEPNNAPAVFAGIFSLIAIVNAFIAISCVRLRDVMKSYIEKASLFSPNFGAKGGRPARPLLPWIGGFSIALTYVSMMMTIMVAAWLAPFYLLGFTFTSFLPAILTLFGVGAWFGLSMWRRVSHERDSTIGYYDDHWQEYVERTQHMDMCEITNHFTQRLPAGAKVLDIGAGSGRDARNFVNLGYQVVALEPSSKLAKHLRHIAGLEVVEIGAEAIEDVSQFDGAWACASLLHLDERRLPEAMHRICRALKPGGILYLSFKVGDGVRIAADGRLFNDMTADDLMRLVKNEGLTVEECWRTPERLPGSNEADWNNIVARKPA